MRILLAVVVLAAVGWSAFWWIVAGREEAGIEKWLEDRAAEGWVAEAESVETKGFPNRIDTTLTALELADPATGVAWTAPFLQLFRLSYEPNHYIVVWPDTQTIASPHQRVTVSTSDARGSFVFLPGTNLTLDRLSVATKSVALSSDAGWQATFEEARLATRPSERIEGLIDIALEARNIRPANAALAALADAGVVPGTLEFITLDASLGFDGTWDRSAIEDARPNPTRLKLTKFQSKWGELELWLAGDLNVDSAGVLSGEVTVKAKNWREMLALAQAIGWVPESFADTLESGLSLVATLAGSPSTLDVPLTITNGQVSLGPIPLGQAPRIKIR